MHTENASPPVSTSNPWNMHTYSKSLQLTTHTHTHIDGFDKLSNLLLLLIWQDKAIWVAHTDIHHVMTCTMNGDTVWINKARVRNNRYEHVANNSWHMYVPQWVHSAQKVSDWTVPRTSWKPVVRTMNRHEVVKYIGKFSCHFFFLLVY